MPRRSLKAADLTPIIARLATSTTMCCDLSIAEADALAATLGHARRMDYLAGYAVKLQNGVTLVPQGVAGPAQLIARRKPSPNRAAT